MTSPTREAGDAVGERPGLVYPLLPLATRHDTRVVIKAALPEAAALDRRAQPPTVLEIDETSPSQSVTAPRQRPHDASNTNAVVITQRAFSGHLNARHQEAAGVNNDSPIAIKKK